ncbi:hypothetical protein AURDEDRAFT_127726 [Auricularia subglabra TFB-10046 SS5]|nr:hypothetical protein AURDEDRAFT_127726 [Auricularia subglabra TFB-10046 SS5]
MAPRRSARTKRAQRLAEAASPVMHPDASSTPTVVHDQTVVDDRAPTPLEQEHYQIGLSNGQGMQPLADARPFVPAQPYAPSGAMRQGYQHFDPDTGILDHQISGPSANHQPQIVANMTMAAAAYGNVAWPMSTYGSGVPGYSGPSNAGPSYLTNLGADPQTRPQNYSAHLYTDFDATLGAQSLQRGDHHPSIDPGAWSFAQYGGYAANDAGMAGVESFYNPPQPSAQIGLSSSESFPVNEGLAASCSHPGFSPVASQWGADLASSEDHLYPGDALQGIWGANASPALAQADGIHGEATSDDASSDVSLSPAGGAPAAVGHHVQQNNIIIPRAKSQPKRSRAKATISEKKTKARRKKRTKKTIQAIKAANNARRAKAAKKGTERCDECGQTHLTVTGLKRHTARYHNRFARNFGASYPCVLCGEYNSITCPAEYRRHRVGDGVPQCAVMADCGGDYAQLLRFLASREVKKGDAGRGLECVAHWQFGGAQGKCFQALCREWAQKRKDPRALWAKFRAQGGRVPKMDLVPNDAEGEGEPAMKWGRKGDCYAPGQEPGVKPKAKKAKKA